MKPQFQTIAVYQDEVATFDYSEDVTSTVWTRLSSKPYVRVEVPKSRWNRELEEMFNELTSLPRGWDGYGGKPLSFDCAQFAAAVVERLFISSLDAPQLVPVSDGSVRLEWHQNQYDIEIDIEGPYEVQAYRRNLRSGYEEEIEIETDFTALAEWINDLSEVDQVPQAVGN